MKRIAVIGAGVSGLTSAHFLKAKYDVTVFEKENQPGGLIKCRRVDGSLFHTCGGHVFNSKRQDVLKWFWTIFSCAEDFAKAERNSCVFMDSADSSNECLSVPYPIENHVYLLDKEIQMKFYNDLDEIDQVKGINPKLEDYKNFGDFLRWRFGKTLYDLYFEPYNKKVWRCDLDEVPMSWMEGKLPMPTTQEMRDNNEKRIEEKEFVHSSFWYEKFYGSQFIADRLAEGLNIRFNKAVQDILYDKGLWYVNGEAFERVIFCGNIKDLPKILRGVDISKFVARIKELKYHGTTAVFCEIDRNPYSWIYQPSHRHESHRIICTGNFAPTNNASTIPNGRTTATIEFTDYISKSDVLINLSRMPLNPKYLDQQYNPYTYPIQDSGTRNMIQELKASLSPFGFYFTGRFADWEYYNMDVAIGASLDLCGKI